MTAPSSAGLREIDGSELRRRLRERGLTIVDVLPAAAFEESHIAGAISLPLADVPARARQVLPDRDAEIAVYCGGPT